MAKSIARSFLLAILSGMAVMASANGGEVHPPLVKYIEARVAEFKRIPAKRQEQLASITEYIESQRTSERPARLLFICTHNSRSSQMGQLWAAVAAAHYGVDGIEVFSGGTESTAFNPRAVAALRRTGFSIEQVDPSQISATPNPHYSVQFAYRREPLDCFSKVYNEKPNPASGFCAIMVCSQADEACPDVPGASQRISLAYDDPKVADYTPEETARYDERCAEIARDMLFVFSPNILRGMTSQ